MFDWLKRYTMPADDFPTFEETNAPEKPASDPTKYPKVFYSIGPTDNNRINFSCGYTSFNMTKLGCQQLIDLLTTAKDSLYDEVEETEEENEQQ